MSGAPLTPFPWTVRRHCYTRVMASHDSVSAFQFKRSKVDGKVRVLNERSYTMGIYNPKTGITSWERVVLATQKAHIESWLLEHFPVLAAA